MDAFKGKGKTRFVGGGESGRAQLWGEESQRWLPESEADAVAQSSLRNCARRSSRQQVGRAGFEGTEPSGVLRESRILGGVK